MASEQGISGPLEVDEATVPCGPRAPFAARTLVTDWLEDRVNAGVLSEARLLVSELVTNSVRHSGAPSAAPVGINVTMFDGVVRVEVRDPGRGADVIRRAPDGVDGGGFGLHLVDMLATRWGVGCEGGTRVWFELPVRPRREHRSRVS